MNIIVRAGELAEAVRVFVGHGRQYYYEVMLSGYTCPQCGGALVMVAESVCLCVSCRHTLDPTVTFQRCTACGGKPRLRICRYRCRRCGMDIPTHFVFDGRVFDREYFRERMAQSRRRKQQKQQRWQEILAANRSETLEKPAIDLDSIPGLAEALDSLAVIPELEAWLPLCKGFDLKRYERHLQAHIGPIEIGFEEIPSLEENPRLDRIWRFIAVIFMAHVGQIEIFHEGTEIMVIAKNETD